MRWFREKASSIADITVQDACTLERGGKEFLLLLLRVTSGTASLYFVPLCRCSGCSLDLFSFGEEAYHDALHEAEFFRIMLSLMDGASIKMEKGELSGFRDGAIPSDISSSRVLGVEQSNTSAVLNGTAIYKHYRKLEEGENPDYEVPLELAGLGFRNTPEPLGRVVYNCSGNYHAGALFRFVENRGDCWSLFTRELERYFRKQGGMDCLDAVKSIGRITSEMHSALASSSAPSFMPGKVEPTDIERWASDFNSLLGQVMSTISSSRLPQKERLMETVSSMEGMERAAYRLRDSYKIRIHGDYHLGQILAARDDFYVIDFEGEPMRSLEFRRNLHTPLRDVAGMLRSFDYASSTASGGGDSAAAAAWRSAAERLFVTTYFDSLRAPWILPDRDKTMPALNLFQAEKALYELNYELNNRPSWIWIPAGAISRLVQKF